MRNVFSNYRCRDLGLRVLLLHAIIPCLCLHAAPCFCDFWHYHPYILQHFLFHLYGDDSCPSQLQSLAEDLQLAGVEGQMDGKLCSSGEGGTDGKDLPVQTCMCGSAHYRV